ncbi:MAG: peptide chain release factor N(5)-glutamine methyltransferase [Lachnospiraceae bacterium]|nr:peptide chain release factor N(5)-glutamine methyltransferase [Lachnospiraceae bacterium]
MKQTLQALFTYGQETLKQQGNPEPELDAKYLLLEAFHTDMVHFLMDRNRELPDAQEIRRMTERYQEMIGQRARRIPLQQILGTQDFMGLSFVVNRYVLIPRQDTETLVELVLKEHPGKGERILDLCTGSGCIAISLAALGNYGPITAVDLSQEALKVAAENCRRLLKEKGRVTLLQGDLFEALRGAVKEPAEGSRSGEPGTETSCSGFQAETEGFDILVSNPPYIPTQVIQGLEPEVRDYEPRMALDGSEDGLEFYRRIAAESPAYLKQGASVYLEIGYDQGDAVRKLLEQAGFIDVQIIKDAPGNDRVAAACWHRP